ncbi:MAG TPA: AraC family transcriptional regulator [Thermoanaerobaculia bacterium]|nr:AraC family transcriptional regulator [Thermoanaerobaculia bacterium]
MVRKDIDATSPAVAKLAKLIGAHAPYDGSFELRVPGVHVIRLSRTNAESIHGIARSAVCIVAQGAKTVMVGEDVYQYEAPQVAVYSVDVPVVAQVTRASHAEPYLTLKLDLDAQRLAELTARVYPHGLPQPRDHRALYVGETDAHILDAATRLLELMAQPGDAELLAPLAIDEILIRLLRGPMGSRVAQIGHAESSVQRVAKAVSWLQTNFDQPVNVDDLAGLVNMSVSSFHRQFKSVTSMSPLQYQKALRLQEARRLMLTAMLDAGSASRRVGYVSASQFSREYGRFFGTAPTRDIHRLRDEGLSAGADAPA